MSVKVLNSPVGSDAVTNSVDSAASIRKSPRRALTMALPLIIEERNSVHMLLFTDQQRNRET